LKKPRKTKRVRQTKTNNQSQKQIIYVNQAGESSNQPAYRNLQHQISIPNDPTFILLNGLQKIDDSLKSLNQLNIQKIQPVYNQPNKPEIPTNNNDIINNTPIIETSNELVTPMKNNEIEKNVNMIAPKSFSYMDTYKNSSSNKNTRNPFNVKFLDESDDETVDEKNNNTSVNTLKKLSNEKLYELYYGNNKKRINPASRSYIINKLKFGQTLKK
jgi:hypothetical protein